MDDTSGNYFSKTNCCSVTVTLFVSFVIGVVACANCFKKNKRQLILRKGVFLPPDYNLFNKNIPAISGYMLHAISWFVTNTYIGKCILKKIESLLDRGCLDNILYEDIPTFLPTMFSMDDRQNDYPLKEKYGDPEHLMKQENVISQTSFSRNDISGYVNAYKSGSKTPTDVGISLIKAIERNESLSPPLIAFSQFNRDDLTEQARESTVRYRNKEPLSVIDGVPFAIKENLSCSGYFHRSGTSFLGGGKCAEDEYIVARLRRAGALIVGVTCMHEFGVGVNGCNPKQLARNPYSTGRYCGGSSSGSACAVSCGLAAVALGNDAGGSLRIPSTLCGVASLKPTFGRVSLGNKDTGCYSVLSNGCVASSVRDLAITYSFIAGPDPEYHPGLFQPEPLLPTLPMDESFTNGKIRIGVDLEYASLACVAIADAYVNSIKLLRGAGFEVVELGISELELSRVAHETVVSHELLSYIATQLASHGNDMNPESRLFGLAAAHFTTQRYLQASRQKTRAIDQFMDIFDNVACVLLPSCADVAPPISDHHLKYGVWDGSGLLKYSKFIFLGNLIGVPTVNIPCGYHEGLPIGIQLLGKWWSEHTILQLADYIEKFHAPQKPMVYDDLLSK